MSRYFLQNLTPEARRILVDINKSRRRFHRNLVKNNPGDDGIYAASLHDTSHVLPDVISRATGGKRVGHLPISDVSENNMTYIVEKAFYNDGILDQIKRGESSISQFPSLQQGKYLAGQNSKTREVIPSRAKAQTDYINKLVDKVNSNQSLKDALVAHQKTALRAAKRQDVSTGQGYYGMMDDVKMSWGGRNLENFSY